MKTLKHVKIGGLCLVSFCLMAVFALGVAGSASAAPLLFVPREKFPYHLAGTGGATLLETLSGSKVSATQTDALYLVLSATLFDADIRFLHVASSGAACTNTSEAETVLMNLLGHLGFADPGNVPAVLLLVPSGFSFVCAGLVTVKIRGSLIGQITKPALNTASEELLLSLTQSKGEQGLTTFLLNNETLVNQFQESAIGGTTFEKSAQAGEGTLKALPGQGTFLLVAP